MAATVSARRSSLCAARSRNPSTSGTGVSPRAASTGSASCSRTAASSVSCRRSVSSSRARSGSARWSRRTCSSDATPRATAASSARVIARATSPSRRSAVSTCRPSASRSSATATSRRARAATDGSSPRASSSPARSRARRDRSSPARCRSAREFASSATRSRSHVSCCSPNAASSVASCSARAVVRRSPATAASAAARSRASSAAGRSPPAVAVTVASSTSRPAIASLASARCAAVSCTRRLCRVLLLAAHRGDRGRCRHRMVGAPADRARLVVEQPGGKLRGHPLEPCLAQCQPVLTRGLLRVRTGAHQVGRGSAVGAQLVASDGREPPLVGSDQAGLRPRQRRRCGRARIPCLLERGPPLRGRVQPLLQLAGRGVELHRLPLHVVGGRGEPVRLDLVVGQHLEAGGLAALLAGQLDERDRRRPRAVGPGAGGRQRAGHRRRRPRRRRTGPGRARPGGGPPR